VAAVFFVLPAAAFIKAACIDQVKLFLVELDKKRADGAKPSTSPPLLPLPPAAAALWKGRPDHR
jgi:hypothetical protein